jgi:hypothetical protein
MVALWERQLAMGALRRARNSSEFVGSNGEQAAILMVPVTVESTSAFTWFVHQSAHRILSWL